MSEERKSNAGRKTLPEGEKKEVITLLVHGRVITKFGGMDAIKQKIYDLLYNDKN